MNPLRRWLADRRRRRETLVLALLTYHPGGWTAYELWRHIGGTAPATYRTLERLRHDDRITDYWVDGPVPRRRFYALPEGEVR